MLLRLSIAVLGSAVFGLAPAQFDPLKNINWGTFKSGQHSQVKDPMVRVLNNEAELQSYWAKAMGDSPNSAPAGTNWMKDQLIAIHLGQRNTGGYSVRVESIERTRAGEITVAYTEFTPVKGSQNLQAMTSPWVLTRMERKAGNLVFKKLTREARSPIVSRGCGCCSACTWSSGPLEEILPAHRELPGPGQRDVWWRTVNQGSRSGIVTYGTSVIRSPEELARYWLLHAGDERLPWDPDRFDWRREQLLAVHLGRMPSAGYEMVLDSLERTGQATITVRFTVVYPSTPMPIGATPSSPYVLLRMDRTPDRFVLVRRNYLPTMDAGWGCACRCLSCKGHR